MVVLGALAVFLCIPRFTGNKAKPARIACVNNLKQIGLSTRQWAMDHGDNYPWASATTNVGTMGHPLFDQPWIHLRPLSNELNTPLVLVCPTDERMKASSGFGPTFGSNNVSYFVGVAAEEMRPQMFLAGDRNLTTNGLWIEPGLYTVNTNHLLGWEKTMHEHAGNVGLADGSVQQFSETALMDAASIKGITNRLAIQ